MTSKEIVSMILEYVGNVENISVATHCITRLRLTLKRFDEVKETEKSRTAILSCRA